MKLLICLITLFSSFASAAISFEIIGPCSSTALARGYIPNTDLSHNTIGEITVDILNDYMIPYSGDAEGMISIFDYKGDFELLSKNSGRAHGWCYSVDGFSPEVTPNEYVLPNQNSHIKWFFGYSTFIFNPDTKVGSWHGQCIPTYEVKPLKFCP